MRPRARMGLAMCCGLLCSTLLGCESMQRKFSRRSQQAPPPSPIINFIDYTRTMTPLDRYRKHYLLFDYWNQELIAALGNPSLNSKRFKLASTESLGELKIMQGLLLEDPGERLTPLIDARTKLDRQLQREAISGSQMSVTARLLETQTRQVSRDFFWRNVQDRVKSQEQPAAPQGPADAAAP